MIVAASILPFLTIARSSPAPTARIVACGGLITAVKSLMPYMPRLDTAVVPPWYSSGLSLRARARAAKSFISLEMVDSDLRLGVADDRRDQAARHRHRDADVGMLVLEHAALGPAHVGVGHALQRQRQRLDDEVVDRELVGRLAVLVLRRGGVDLLARGQQLADLAVDRQVEMRDGLLRLRSGAARWCGACRRAARPRSCPPRTARGPVRPTSTARWRRGRGAAAGAPARLHALAGLRAFDVARDDAAVRAGALDARRYRCRLPWPAAAPAARRTRGRRR